MVYLFKCVNNFVFKATNKEKNTRERSYVVLLMLKQMHSAVQNCCFHSLKVAKRIGKRPMKSAPKSGMTKKDGE